MAPCSFRKMLKLKVKAFNPLIASKQATDTGQVVSYPSFGLKEVGDGHFTARRGWTSREEDKRESRGCGGIFP